MATNIEPETAERLILEAFENIRTRVEAGSTPLSSETTFRFLFAWELGRILEFSGDYRFDFEWNAFEKIDTDDKRLDLLVFTDPNFKIALEFKLPKSSRLHKTNSTQTRGKMLRDISRLSYLVQNGINSVGIGYFLCATDEGTYISEGQKTVNVHYKTYNGMVYKPGTIIPAEDGVNPIPS